MSILITGIDIPTKGNPITVTIYPDGTAEWEAQHKTGTAIPVPKHGRLIDADVYEELIRELGNREPRLESKIICDAIKFLYPHYAPTVILASDENDAEPLKEE